MNVSIHMDKYVLMNVQWIYAHAYAAAYVYLEVFCVRLFTVLVCVHGCVCACTLASVCIACICMSMPMCTPPSGQILCNLFPTDLMQVDCW